MTPAGLPPWPAAPVAHGPVVLRQFTARDVPMAQELSTDPYVPLVGSLPANASREQARDWVSYEEKGTWVYLVTSAGAYAVYLVIILGRLASTPAAQVPYVAVLLWTAGASMVANMAGRILVETASPERQPPGRRAGPGRQPVRRARQPLVRRCRRGGAGHGDGALGLLLDRQRHLPRVRAVGGGRVGAEAGRLPAGAVAAG